MSAHNCPSFPCPICHPPLLGSGGAAFTPGPWALESVGDYAPDFGAVFVLGKPPPQRAETVLLLAKINDRESHIESRANAHLIAAVPDMFEALAAALTVHGDGYSWGAKAKSALAKARGRQ